MATTIDAAFEQYRSSIEITDWQRSLVSQRRLSVERCLRTGLSLDPSYAPQVMGSWDRHTLIAPLATADVDILVALDRHQHGEWNNSAGTIAALNRFKAVLESGFLRTPIRRDQNCITMQFDEFRLDIVPAFRFRRPIGNREYFTIPDSVRKRWVPTNPFKFAQMITHVNKLMDKKFVPLIKMAKGWNRAAGWPVRSIHLEAMLYYYFHGWVKRFVAELHRFSYPWLLKSFFTELPRYLRGSCLDPVMDDRLDAYLDNTAKRTKRVIAIEKARTAQAASQFAYSLQKNDPVTAIAKWRDLMGKEFPGYG